MPADPLLFALSDTSTTTSLIPGIKGPVHRMSPEPSSRASRPCAHDLLIASFSHDPFCFRTPSVRKQLNMTRTGPVNHPPLFAAGLAVAMTIGWAVAGIAMVKSAAAIGTPRGLAPFTIGIKGERR
jgi:hypothetical protein